MGENPKYPKIIRRGSFDNKSILFGGMKGEVEYSGKWEDVEGGKGVRFRAWTIKGVDANVDGGDIIIEAGGYTPIQLVNAAEVVVDVPEKGEAYSCVMDEDGRVYINHFDGTEEEQMVWTEGMIITWVAATEVRLTEFESPTFGEGMFIDVPEDSPHFQGRDVSEYLKIVNDLREKVKVSP